MHIKVSVIILTYNHERFIAQAIESVLAQKRDFGIELIVVDDGSADKTSQIIKELSLSHPEIRFWASDKNKGVRNSVFEACKNIKGEYFSVLDGDDYWNNVEKLQTQVDFLEKNGDYNGSFHDAQIIHEGNAGEILFGKKKYYSQSFDFNDVIYPVDILRRQITLPSSSALLRTSVLGQVDLTLLDDNYSILWKMTCFMIKNSKFYYINEAWSVYRNHDSGISKRDNMEFRLSHIRFLKKMLNDRYYSFYTYEIYQTVANEYKLLLESKNVLVGFNKNKWLGNVVKYELLKLWHYTKRIKKNEL